MLRLLRNPLRLWFAFSTPVGRRDYFVSGLSLMIFKYAVDALVVWLAVHRIWTPLDYLNPLYSTRSARLIGPSPVVSWLMMLWTLPFLWIGVSMSMRRAVDAGRSAWWSLLFFLPLMNYAFMLTLAALPSRPGRAWREAEPAPVVDGRLRWALIGMALSLLGACAMVALNTVVLKRYGLSLFVATPFMLGAIGGFVFNFRQPRSLAATLEVAGLTLVFACGALVLFALEGVLCVAMAFPLALAVVLLGAVLGRAIALHAPGRPAHAALAALLLPGVASLDHAGSPLREVRSSVVITAPPQAVWQRVVEFNELPQPSRLLFRLGIAYPRRARIVGRGVGAIRTCEFSTGPFVEPITRWEEPRRLDFDVASQPPPMHEWSPYPRVFAAHLSRSFRSRRGEFRLIPLAGGGTRLEGSTWYQLEMEPQLYWTMYSDAIIHAIHQRVLEHIRTLCETP